MSVLKLSKNDIIKNVDMGEKIKLKKSDLSFDSASASGWEQTNRQSLDILNEFNDRINNGGWLSEEEREEYRKALDTYIDTTNRLMGINKTFGEGYSEEDEKSWLESVESMNKGYEELSSIFDKFSTGEEYTDAVKLNELNSMTTDELLRYISDDKKHGGSGIAYTTSSGQNITWKKLYDEKKKKDEAEALYKGLSSSDDWEEYVAKGANIENPEFDDARIDKWNVWEALFKDKISNPVVFGRENIENLGNKFGQAGSSGDAGAVNEYYRYQFMEDEEVEIYNYYLAKYGDKKASEYLKSIEKDLTDRQEGKALEKLMLSAYEHPFLASASSVLMNLGAGYEYVADTIDYWKTGELDTNFMAQASSTIRSTVSDKVDWEIGNWDAFDFLYNTSMSAVDSVASMGLFGGAGGVALGLSAAAQGTNDALNRGMSSKDAFWSGFTSGVFEGLFETVSIGQFNVMKEVASTTFRQIAKNVAKTMLVNATEETWTEIANIAYDYIANGDFSQYETSIRQYMQNGMTEAEAKKKVALELGAQVAEAGASGALMGFGFGVVGSGYNYIKGSIDSKKAYGDGTGLVNEALNFTTEGSEARTLAEGFQKKLDDGKKLSGANLYELHEAIKSNDKTKMVSATEARLTELGAEADVKQLAEIIVKQASGEKLSLAEKTALKNSYVGQRVANEISPENIASGEYTSSWAENIGTRRINVESYNKDLYDLAKAVAGFKEAVEKESVTKTATEEENATATKFEASDDGETIIQSTGETVSIKGVSSIKGGTLMLELDNGKVVDAKDVSFGSNDDALVYEMVTDMDVSPQTANALIKGFKATDGVSAEAYKAYIPLAYKYGMMNYKAGLDSIDLTAEQKNMAFVLGSDEAKTLGRTWSDTSRRANDTTKAKSSEDGIIYEGFELNEDSLTDIQKASLAGVRTIAKMSSLEIHIYEGVIENGTRYATVNGKKRKAPNGYFRDGNRIYIDLNAGSSSQGTMLYTMSHEVGHYIAENSWKDFKALGDFLFEHYGKNDVPVDVLINREIEKLKASYKADKKPLPSPNDLYMKAYEEVVCDAMSNMFADPKAYEKLAILKSKNKTLWQKLGDAIKMLLDKLKTLLGAYDGHTPDAQAALYVGKFSTDVYNKLQDLYLKSFVQADANFESANRALAESGIMVDSKTESATLYSVNYLLNSKEQQKVADTLAERFGVTAQEAKGWISAETSLASLILNPKYSQYLDYEADASEEAIKSNSDYPQGTVDFSNICKKRRDFTEVMNRVLRNFPNHVFAATDLAKIRTIMSEEGMEVACGICYVEDRRQLDSIVAQDFIDSLDLYRKGSKTRPDGKAFNANQIKALKLVDGDTYTPSIYELISLEGKNILKAKNPAMEEAWVKFNNARGMQSVRLLLNDAEYKRQILKYTPAVVERKNNLGGLRIYSFSDMEMFHLIDIVQVITDSATVGLSLQGYTKVNEYARAVKDTGEKLNRSLIPKGDLGYHMENGKVVLDFDTVEGIDINHPDFFDNISNPNIGNIVIGINDTQIRAAMISTFIDQIIPFHTGQSGEVLGEKGIASWQNYKDYQSERDIDTGKKSSHQINIYTEVIQAAEKEGHPITNKKEFVEKFLEVCKANKLIPRFSQFLNFDENGDYAYTEGYHKFLVDFKTFDQKTGEYLPQMPVKPVFDNAYLTKLLKDYVKTQKVKDAHLADTMPKVLDRITKEVVGAESDVLFSERDDAPNAFNPEGKTLREQLQEALDTSESKERRYVYVGKFTQEFVDRLKKHIDIKKLPIVMNYRDAYLSMEAKERGKYQGDGINYHNLGVDGLEAALNSFSDPEYVLLSNREGKIELVLQGRDYKNRQLFSIVEVNTKAQGNRNFLDVHVVTSVYGNRGIKNRILAAGEEGRIIYKKEEESTQGMPQVQYERDINANSSKESIPQPSKSVKGETENTDTLFSEADYVPTFYSHMGKVIDGIKSDKVGAGGVVPYLKGKGVKNEEIKWSGIETFLEGKKSVTKEELQEFVAGSQLQISEQMSGEDIDLRYDGSKRAYSLYDKDGKVVDTYTYNEFLDGYVSESDEEIYSNEMELKEALREEYGTTSAPRWAQYKLDGGTNYRELVFTLPNSTYSNRAMRVHWGEDAEGVLAHARIQDMTTADGKKMLFIEELQSDWHNEGREKGYTTKEYEDAVAVYDKLADDYAKKRQAFNKYVRSSEFRSDPDEVSKKKFDWLRSKMETAEKRMQDAERDIEALKKKGMGDVADAPFRDTYHEYVLKRLLRMAAEEGYDSIGWTPADIQSKRWSYDYEKAYKIEYDQEMPKFLRKYGKQWGAEVGKTPLPGLNSKETYYDVNREEAFDSFAVWQDTVRETIDQQGGDQRNVLFGMDGNDWIAYDKRTGIEYDRAKVSKTSDSVWSMDITDSMKDSVLNEGQVLYSEVEFPSDAEEIAKEYFGTTTKWSETGWLLKDGTRLDFSGRHWERDPESEIDLGESYYRGKRNMEHFEVAEAFPEHRGISDMAHRGDVLGGFLNRGNIRVVGKGCIDLYTMPTEEQFEMLSDYFRENIDKHIVVGIKNDGLEFEKGTSASTIIEGIRDYFAKNKSRQSSLMRFHTDYSEQDPDSVSNRTLLANALESVAQNEIEKNKLKQYKEKVALIESEQAKLTRLRAEAYELRFKKGRTEAETKRMRELDFEATQTANRINTYDKQLLSLETTTALKGVLEREKAMLRKRLERKNKEVLSAYKEKEAKKTRELLTRHQESRKKALDSRHRTEMRHKIKKVVSDLDHLLRSGTKERNVKLGLQTAVASALEAVNMDTVAAEERISKLKEELMKAKTPEKIQEISRTIDNIQAQGDRMQSKLEELRQAYADIKASEENIPEYYRSEASLIESKVDAVVKVVGNTPLRNMSLAQLEAVYDLYRMVLTTVRNTNATFIEGKLEDLHRNASDIMTELESIRKMKEERLGAGGAVNSFSWNEMIPAYAFERIGSNTLTRFFWEAVRGQNTYAVDINEANEFSTETRKKFGYSKWDLGKVHEFKLADGRTFRVTLKHMMSIYAYSKRDQALAHMQKGGFFFNDKETFRREKKVLKVIKSNEEGYCVDEAVLESIKKAMTSEQIQYVDAMQEYLTKMGDKGNEVSRVLWGIDIFKEKIYFPLKSCSDFIYQANQPAQESSLKNDGMTKEVKPGASNPIVLESFDDVWANHVNRMSMYHSFVLPIENLNKVLNYGTWIGTSSMAISTMLSARYGSAVNEYLTNFIKDMNGASSMYGASNPFFSMVSKFKKTAVAASMSVVVQQPTAVLRALAVMDAKYFVGKPNLAKLSQKWEELKQYAPIAIIKEIGGFDAGGGRQTAEWLNADAKQGIDKVMGKVDDLTMMGAALGDEVGWTTIWEAVKRETKATTNLKEGSEEFFKKAGERFTEVIVKTQVYDSTLSRSGYMRSKHDSVKMLTAFMGEPTVSFNMMFNAVSQAVKKKMSKKESARIIGSVYASVVMASVASSMIYALRDDDDDESYLEKLAEAFSDKLLSEINPLNMLPAVRDIMTVLDGWDVSRTDMDIFQDIYDAITTLDSENKSAWRKVEDLSGAFASLFGVPLKNILRTGREIYNLFKNIFDGVSPSGVGDAFVRGITGEKKDKGKALYDAIVNGDQARIEIYRKGYKDDKAYESAVRSALRENDPRIQEAVIATLEGDGAKRVDIVKEIKDEGHFAYDLIQGAVNNELQNFKSKIKDARKAKENNKAEEYNKIIKELRKKYPDDFIEEMLEAPWS